MQKKKILYLFSDTGGGHRSSASAIMKAVEELKKKDAPLQEMVDVFTECSAFLGMLAKLYGPVIKYSPKMWGVLYHWLNDMKKMQQMEKLARPFIQKELGRLILDRKPDIIVSVHPLLNHLTVAAMEDVKYIVPLITVVTDPVSLHRAWVCPDADMIIVATQDAKRHALEYGGDKNKIRVIGLPIDPRFAKPAASKAMKKRELGLDPGRFTVLLMGGGEGGGNMLKIVRSIDKAGLNIQLIVIAGRNEKLKKQLEIMSERLSYRMKVYGFTNEVPEIMSASDLIITKAGPGSIAEALAKELPIVITSWLPGQEEGNVNYVLDKRLGVICRDFRQIAKTIKEMQAPKNLNRIRANIKKVNNPRAVFEIAHIILEKIPLR
ncbi:MAG: glycosyltransferase [Candidatus Saganbacteria bacterium]|nr:glycosyltransferase [Candidatus Saganbacteria bacterium]